MINLQRGDFFCVTNHSLLQSGIKAVSGAMAIDNKAEYGHAGIITSSYGGTFEAVTTYSRHNLWARYAGCDVLIGRHRGMTQFKHVDGMEAIKGLEGHMYPFFRLALWLVPFIPKYIKWGRPVCSEMCFMYGRAAKLKDMDYCWGVSPDYMADAIQRWDVFDVILKERLQNVQ